MRLWFPGKKRKKSKPTDEISNDGSSQQAGEDEEQEEELVIPSSSMAFSDAARDPISYLYPSSSTIRILATPEQTPWEGNHLNTPTSPGANMPTRMTNTTPQRMIPVRYSPQRSNTPKRLYGFHESFEEP